METTCGASGGSEVQGVLRFAQDDRAVGDDRAVESRDSACIRMLSSDSLTFIAGRSE
jgi:hypothetical protein